MSWHLAAMNKMGGLLNFYFLFFFGFVIGKEEEKNKPQFVEARLMVFMKIDFICFFY